MKQRTVLNAIPLDVYDMLEKDGYFIDNDITDEESKWNAVYDEINISLEYLNEAYGYDTYNFVLVADLGLWNGRQRGYKVLTDVTIQELVNVACGCDEYKYYIDAYNLRFTGSHHDGNNRMVIKLIPDQFLDNVLAAVDNGTLTASKLKRYTRSARRLFI